ncbi:hypothetical protein LBMAG53_19830 [Planctomycetota bacterium]|nr:hypothetical protein LBMAG53_19830 [Planctomycetota bacterium]
MHGLLERSGLTEEARQIAPGTVGVSRFGIAPEAPGSIAILQRALRTGQAVYFSYRNRHSVDHPSHVWPIRLVMIKGEWFCFAWAPSDGKGTGRVKQYALSRITSRDPAVSIADRLPLGAPIRQPHDEVDAILASGFHATGSVKPQDRSRVVLAVSPEAWPSIANRTWGEHQLIDTGPEDLPPGWRRLTFSTTGLPEARHWVASFGSFVRPEGPPELMFWLKNEAERVASILAHMPAKQPAQISDTVIP